MSRTGPRIRGLGHRAALPETRREDPPPGRARQAPWPRSQLSVSKKLQSELKERYTIVLVTHSMFRAPRISQRTGIEADGEVIEVGPTERVFETPRHQRTDNRRRIESG